MDIRTKIMAAATLAGVLHAASWADTVELVNGDALTGKVVSQARGKVVFEHAQLGRIELLAEQVRQVRIDGDQARDLTPEGGGPIDAPGGVAVPDPDPPPPPVAPDPAAVVANANQAAQEEQPTLLDSFIEQWNTKLTIGFTGTAGNTDRQNYHAKLDTTYETDVRRWTVNSSWFYAVANSRRTQNELLTKVTHDWLQKNNPWFFFVRGEHEYDQFRAWENRASVFGGAGYTVVDEKEFEVKARLGLGGTYEFGQINEFTPEAFFGGSAAKWKINKRQTLSGESVYYPSLEDSADFRIQTKLEWLYKLDLGSGMSLKLGVQNEYESQTPGDNSNNDFKYYGALVISF